MSREYLSPADITDCDPHRSGFHRARLWVVAENARGEWSEGTFCARPDTAIRLAHQIVRPLPEGLASDNPTVAVHIFHVHTSRSGGAPGQPATECDAYLSIEAPALALADAPVERSPLAPEGDARCEAVHMEVHPRSAHPALCCDDLDCGERAWRSGAWYRANADILDAQIRADDSALDAGEVDAIASANADRCPFRVEGKQACPVAWGGYCATCSPDDCGEWPAPVDAGEGRGAECGEWSAETVALALAGATLADGLKIGARLAHLAERGEELRHLADAPVGEWLARARGEVAL